MANAVIVGMQWGDEGKGKIVDLLCPAFDGVVRYQGGHNAGHTVKFRDRHFSLQLIPSGILHPDMMCVLGNGMVVAPAASAPPRGGSARPMRARPRGPACEWWTSSRPTSRSACACCCRASRPS